MLRNVQVLTPVKKSLQLHYVINTVDQSLIRKYCVVRYDNGAYTGTIEDLDDTDVQVRCMYKAGHNKFYWWTTVPYICWYSVLV